MRSRFRFQIVAAACAVVWSITSTAPSGAATQPVMDASVASALYPGSTVRSVAAGINDAGTVVGIRDEEAFAGEVGGEMRDIGHLPGHVGSLARAVNNHEVAVGASFPSGSGWRAVTFDLVTGAITDLGDVPGFADAEAWDISDSGIVVGNGGAITPASRAWFKLPGGPITLIPTLGGDRSGATAVNESGIVVGWSSTTGGAAEHAFAYDIGTGALTDLGTLGGRDSHAADVNESGLVVGWSATSAGGNRAFLVDLASPTMVGLGTLGGNVSGAASINDAGTIVGYSTDATNSPFFGFASNLAAPPMLKLPGYEGPIFPESEARAVNNQNVVVGQARLDEVALGTAASWTLGSLPDAPDAPTVGGCDTTATITWAVPFDGNRPVTGSTVLLDGEVIAEVEGGTTTFVDEHAAPGSAYSVRVSNSLGDGPASAAASFDPGPCPPDPTTTTSTTTAPTTPTTGSTAGVPPASPVAVAVVAEPRLAG